MTLPVGLCRAIMPPQRLETPQHSRPPGVSLHVGSPEISPNGLVSAHDAGDGVLGDCDVARNPCDTAHLKAFGEVSVTLGND